ncbi:MAG TPA: AAA family ATPase [Sedimentibacter sp.]|nr:AAA family ATPase [Sedimentibacter sp.]
MRPINLKIKGLNSFIEAQEINFETLTEKGLFGIFGPTGSGKSTILDGITLALYGEVSRKSTNYMNTNCDSMSVSYEFQMADKEVKRYRVDREFKRDNKSGNVRTKSAIIVDKTNGEHVLEDKIRSVTEKCEEIIGLKLDDFTRTVVLPQGKFSEFLKLEGRERREMLERLFNLQKYGDELSIKLGIKIKEENQKSDKLDGELNSYEDVSDDVIKEKNSILDITKEQLKSCRDELTAAEKAFNEGKDLWELQKELKELKNKEESLKEQENEIILNKEKVSSGESSLKVKPYVDGYENTLKQIATVKSDIDKLNNKAKVIKENKKQAESKYQEAKIKKDTELPILKIKEQQIIEAIEEKRALDLLIIDNNALKAEVIKNDEKLMLTNKNIESSSKNIISLNNEITTKENKAETLKVPEEFKNKVNEGFLILNDCQGIKKQINSIDKDIQSTKQNIDEAKIKSENVSKLLKVKQTTLDDSTTNLKDLNDNCPGDQNTLLNLKEKLTYAKENWDKDKEYTTLIEKSLEKAQVLKIELEKKKQNKTVLYDEIKILKDEIKSLETENLAFVLRESLTDGDTCPVCGSIEHHKENIVTINKSASIEKLRQNLKSMEENYETLSTQIVKFEERLTSEESSINDNNLKLNNLGREYKNYSVKAIQEEFSLLYNALNKYNSDKASLEKTVQTLSEEKNSLLLDFNNANNALIHNRELLGKILTDKERKNKELSEADQKLSLLKIEISVEDFKLVRIDIDNKEKERTSLEKDIRNQRNKLNLEQQHKDNLTTELSDLKIELKEKKTKIEEKTKNIEEKLKSINNKAGNVDNLETIKNETSKSIKHIENLFDSAEKEKNKTEESFNEINNQIMSFQGNLVSLQERSIEDKNKLDKALSEEGIVDIEEAKNNFIPKNEIDKLKIIIENYNNALAQLKGALSNLNKKINNRNLSEDEWIEIQNNKKEKTLILDELQKTATSIEVELKSLLVKIEVKKNLLKEKQKLDHNRALLSDLDKLFRGKKFVEFVAANQLKYVSIEASKKLKEITGGTYGLEVDENGKFLIRDYKNGGAQRDASTLSGGETFVASLALALALSSQIQLKGTSPLELFFLDEGFGTLDDNLLDVVMDSLEKIHHKRLSIGIISHVESIKNRVPVKLIVSPAVAGLGGSKVKVERS